MLYLNLNLIQIFNLNVNVKYKLTVKYSCFCWDLVRLALWRTSIAGLNTRGVKSQAAPHTSQ